MITVSRREALGILTLGGMALLWQGHAPYRQWVAYRKDHLMLVASRQRPEAFPLVEVLAEELARAIPAAKPRATRAPSIRHITRLILSRQIDVAVVTGEEARNMARGEGEGAPEGAAPLRLVAFLRSPYVVVCHAEFGRDQAYLLAFGVHDEASSPVLNPETDTLPAIMRQANELGIPLHVGAREFYLERQQSRRDAGA